MTYEALRCSWILHALAATAALGLLIAEPAPAQSTGSTGPIWEEIVDLPETAATELVEPDGSRPFRAFALDREALDAILDLVPPARLAAPEGRAVSEVPLPMPDGTRRTFRVRPSPVLAPVLEARYPQIRTFEGRQVDDPAVTVRFDVSPEGVAGRVFFPDPTAAFPSNDVVITATEDAAIHTSAFLSAYTPPPRRRCLFEGEEVPAAPEALGALASLSSGRDLRTYRLAVAATGEFTQANGGTVESVLLRIARTVNTLNEIYERDAGVRFQLVADNDQVIFTDGRTDPFDNGDAKVLLQQSQTTLDCFVGDENYDVGHTFSVGDSVANLGVAGVSRQKGTGTTGASAQGQTVFDVDYVAHELGHQFGATHTYNGSAGDCSAKSRSAGTAYEPGSGSTIMGYAGVCDVDDLQPSSDAYFHSVSLTQIRDHVENGPGSHPPPVPTGNQPPNVDAGDAYAIPIDTPFTLTATGDDPDGDALTYCWEELDLGSPRPLVAPDDGQSPLFRSFAPTASPSRTFPRHAGRPAFSKTPGERLPVLGRVMRFRVTARDDHRGGGGVASDETTVTAHAGADPFEITSPASGSRQAGLLYLEWEVAGTDAEPISVDRVNLRLHPEDDSPPIPLLFDTSNDGQELVALPDALNTRGRLRLETVDNVFFAVTDDIVIVPARATVFVVRHAEKETGDDPPLTPEGVERAQALAYLLASSQIDRVYSTPTRRTRQTAQPTADLFGVNVLEYRSTAELLAAPGAFGSGHHVLVVGHSNTVPEVLQALGVEDDVRIGNDFDRLFIVSLTDDGAVLQPFRHSRDGRLRRDADD